MTAELVDLVLKLTSVIEEESDMLFNSRCQECLDKLAASKARLAGDLQASFKSLEATNSHWTSEPNLEACKRFVASMSVLNEAAIANAQVLNRRIALAEEYLSALVIEALRPFGLKDAAGAGRAS